MNIADQCVASFHYTLKDSEGELIDSSEGKDPLAYLHGAQNIVVGLEKELTGKVAGDKFSVIVSPDEGYGPQDPNMVQALSRDMFGGVDTIEVGMQFHAQTPNGMQVVEVIEVEGDQVTIDGNHPLAGVELHFEIEITSVRAATDDELTNGHVQGANDEQS
jgi:FKBP-type peptidyl-prolyl cis-trans isomerase SlyD